MCTPPPPLLPPPSLPLPPPPYSHPPCFTDVGVFFQRSCLERRPLSPSKLSLLAIRPFPSLCRVPKTFDYLDFPPCAPASLFWTSSKKEWLSLFVFFGLRCCIAQPPLLLSFFFKIVTFCALLCTLNNSCLFLLCVCLVFRGTTVCT